MWTLPKTVTISGVEYDIRSDYRAVLDICTALCDPDLSDQDKAEAALRIFYPDVETIPPENYEEAVRQCFMFINCGDEDNGQRKAPKLVDWEQDFQYIVAPINRVAGTEIRNVEYMHWWTFVGYYYEIGDCLFAQIVRIRDKIARGKPLDKAERVWLGQSRHLVDFKHKYSEAEEEILKQWTT